MSASIEDPEGFVLVEGGTEIAVALLDAAVAAGVDPALITISPIRNGFVVPIAIAEAGAAAETAAVNTAKAARAAKSAASTDAAPAE